MRSVKGILLAGALLAACRNLFPGNAGGGPAMGSTQTLSPTPFLPVSSITASAMESILPSDSTPVPSLWISPLLPESFRSSYAPPPGWAVVDSPDLASVRIEIGGGIPLASWVYALAAPFPTVADGVTGEDLLQAWSGAGGGYFAGRPLLMDPNTMNVWSALWGMPAPGSTTVMPAGELLDSAWSNRPSWALVPWESVQPRWKVLEVDGISPMRKEFDPAAYRLTVPISLSGDADLCATAAAESIFEPTNREGSKLTVVILTGVTALVRATAHTMEQKGITYPAKNIGPVLRAADLTHISNEIPFAKNCPYPNPAPDLYPFCSDPRYIELLEYVGTDVVEMTGNHVRDYGSEALLYTFDLYRQRGWAFYASGENLASARKPVYLEHNGNRLAFIGCNKPGYNNEWATEASPGAAPCDFEYLKEEIPQLVQEGYLPIMTFQYYEDYEYETTDIQIRDFTAMAESGAVIVSGSQAHQPKGFSFSGGSLIHYGLGNLFFDQYNYREGTQYGFIDRHVFYDGRYLGAELITILFTDYAQSRWMTSEERSAFLEKIFTASGW